MGVLITTNSGTHFSPTLLRNIEHRYNAEVLSALRDVDPRNLKDSTGMTLLHFAAQYGHDEFARYLIDSGVDVDAQNQAKETPLIIAVEHYKLEIVQILLEANANIFIPNLFGYCALEKALYVETTGSNDISTALLSKVTSQSLRNSKHITSTFHIECPLYHFVALRDADITRALLVKGSPVNVRDPSTGDTALHVAVKQRDWENVKVLIEYSASLEIKNRVAEAPLEAVWMEDSDDHAEILDVLKVMIRVGHGYDGCANIAQGLLRHGNREIVRAALPSTLNLYAKLSVGHENFSQPLFDVCLNKTPDIHEELRAVSFDVNARCSSGETMLHWAVRAGNPGTVKFLLDRGADVDAKNLKVGTPLRVLVYYFMVVWKDDASLDEGSFKRCVEILLEHGADPQIFVQGTAYLSVRVLACKISDEIVAVVEPVLTRVALVDVGGPGVKLDVRGEIKSVREFEEIFLFVRRHLEEMKSIGIDDGVSLLDFYVESERKMSRFALNRRLVAKVEHAVMTICTMDSYCHYKLCERFLKVNALVMLRKKVATSLDAIFMELCGVSVYNIADRIVSYVSDKDLSKML